MRILRLPRGQANRSFSCKWWRRCTRSFF